MRFSNSIPGLCLIVSAAGVMVLATGSARGHNSYVTPWTNAYPTSTLQARMATATGSACNVCHQPPERASAGTCYKDALALRINAGRTISQAIADVDGLDSDGSAGAGRVSPRAARRDGHRPVRRFPDGRGEQRPRDPAAGVPG
jgi:cytochrome c5